MTDIRDDGLLTIYPNYNLTYYETDFYFIPTINDSFTWVLGPGQIKFQDKEIHGEATLFQELSVFIH